MIKPHIVSALERILHMRVWDYGADFNELWRMESLGTAHVIIVWIDTPDDPSVSPVVTVPYLTPFDWAIAARCQYPTLNVTVLDLRPNEHEQGGYAALGWMRTQRPECIPWLRRVLVRDLLDAADPDALRSLFRSRPIIPVGIMAVEPRDVLRSLPVCHVDLSGDASHHAIANLLGPLLLLRESAALASAVGVTHRLALRQLLLAAGLISKSETGSSDNEAIAGRGGAITLAELGNVRLLLLDDQWHHGWAEWIGERLNLKWDNATAERAREPARQTPQLVAGAANSGVSLWVLSSPIWLLERSKKALDGKARDARFDLSLTDGGSKGIELLLLDLRLFSQGGRDEKEFAGELAKLARRFMTSDVWAPFDEAELNAIESWSTGKDDDDRSGVLTLLPRLLAHIDLSLPIVLFSSTGRRDVVEKLQGYSNIFTHFSKPRIFGELTSDIVERAEDTFAAAIDSAQWWAATRELCRRLLRAAAQSEPVKLRAPSQFRHFELYLDESGSSGAGADPDAAEPEQQRFVIGGLLVGYSSALDGPLDLHRRMEVKGLRWWPEDFYSTYLLKRDRGGDGELEDLPGGVARDPDKILAEFFQCLGGMREYGICLEYRNGAELGEPDQLRAQWRSDNRYRLVLSTLLELLLFDVLPEIVSTDATLSVFVATRARVAREFQGGEATIERLRELYGYVGGRSHFQSLNDASVLPVVLETLERRGGPLSASRLEHARGVRLSYPKIEADERADGPSAALDKELHPIIRDPRPPWRLTRHQHYVADIVAHLCRRTGAKFPWKSNVSQLFETGIYDVLDARLDTLLRAARALEMGDRSGALLAIANSDLGRPFAKRSASMLLLQRLAKATREDLNGEDFARLALAIDSEPPVLTQPRSAAAERGIVKAFLPQKGYGFIRATAAGDQCFFHITAWQNATYPSIGDIVEFTRSRDREGRERASWVQAVV